MVDNHQRYRRIVDSHRVVDTHLVVLEVHTCLAVVDIRLVEHSPLVVGSRLAVDILPDNLCLDL